MNKYAKLLSTNKEVIIDHFKAEHPKYEEFLKVDAEHTAIKKTFDEIRQAAHRYTSTGEINHPYKTVPCMVKLELARDWEKIYFPEETMRLQELGMIWSELVVEIADYAENIYSKLYVLASVTKARDKELDDLLQKIGRSK
jgi:hypothetical protein